MSQVLQEHEREIRRTSVPVRTTELILDRTFCGKVRDFVDDCKSEVRVMAYAWRWYDNDPASEIQRLNIALLNVVRWGRPVRVIVTNYDMFVHLSQLGFDVRYVHRGEMLHSKAIAIDRKTLIIGSHNLTKRATEQNFEVSVAIQDADVVEQFCEYFDRVWERCNAS
jgi:phosphatidylserine/phosphatidylglycerophosphate/cardiolipin synthase-like enzyme